MKAPRFFLGSVVLFWGWQVHTLWIAICLAITLESARVTKSKFRFKPSDFNKFIDITIVLLAGTIVIALTYEAQKAILILLKWLPLIFFPIMAAQEFSVKGAIAYQSFFIGNRKRLKIKMLESKDIDISFLYALFCIFSAATANTKGHLFYVVVVLYSIWALWQVRSKRVSFFLWIISVFIIVISGYAGHNGIHMASMRISQWAMEYYGNYYGANPFKNFTALGEIGKLKLSDKIILRVSLKDYIPGKNYFFHTASYPGFSISNWFAGFEFESIEPANDKTSWQINPFTGPTPKMTLYFRPAGKRAVLSLPSGVIAISQMKAGACEKNAVQSVRIEEVPSLIKAVVSYTDTLSYDAIPSKQDLLVPEIEIPGIVKIAEELALENRPEDEILKILKHYFLTEYTYSLDLKGKQEQKTPLQNFLNHTQAGHCEFFATATTLLLRKAHIPARYATGYMAHEYSRLENSLIVRQCDAHAWVKVFINGQWRNFDTTPPLSLQAGNQKIDPSRIRDFFSFLGFKLSRIRHETGPKMMDEFGLWLILPLGLILFFRLIKSNKIRRIKVSGNTREEPGQNFNDISFGLIEVKLTKQGFPRYSHETYFSWLDRIGHHFDNKNINNNLQTLLQLHNRYRFSRFGLKKEEQKDFESRIKNIMKKLTTASI
jgi:transglutaminase-like putative cysteine protease